MIYLDHASTTYVYPEVISIITKTLKNNWGNPSNIYKFGQESKQIINTAREQIAQAINCSPQEIFFTSGSSEGNAWALKQRTKCLSSVFEHHNITENDNSILVDEDYLKKLLKMPAEMKLLYKQYMFSHMYVSNETGEIFDIESLFALAKQLGMFTHCDMTQAIGNLVIDFQNDKLKNIDMATCSGHKIHAPKGIGFAYIKEDAQKDIKPLLYGGIQEKGIRAGTENVPYIAGLGIAVTKAVKNISKKNLHCKELREYAIHFLKANKINCIINSGKNNLNSTLNFCLPHIEGEILQAILSEKEIYIGTGSACGNGLLEESKTLAAMQVPKEYINGEIRLSFDISNTLEEVKTTLINILEVYNQLTNIDNN